MIDKIHSIETIDGRKLYYICNINALEQIQIMYGTTDKFINTISQNEKEEIKYSDLVSIFTTMVNEGQAIKGEESVTQEYIKRHLDLIPFFLTQMIIESLAECMKVPKKD